MSIKNELGEMDGVKTVDGDPNTKTITVEFDAPADIDRIKNTLKEINYPAA
jgi:copper chaperone CopZ